MLEFSICYPFYPFLFVERYCINLFSSWNTLVSPSMVIESFAGYSSLGWHFCSLRVCITSDQDLRAFVVSVEKSSIILIGLPLYVSWSFSITAFNILFFFFWFFWDRVSLCSSGCPGTHSENHAGLELWNLPASAS